MSVNKEAGVVSRRDFLKNFSGHFIENIRIITKSWTDIAAREKSDGYPDNSVHAQKEPGVAFLNIELCLAWGEASCQLCYLACPLRDKALEMREQKPVIIPSFCNGCAMCAVACKTINTSSAIEIVSANTLRKETLKPCSI